MGNEANKLLSEGERPEEVERESGFADYRNCGALGNASDDDYSSRKIVDLNSYNASGISIAEGSD